MTKSNNNLLNFANSYEKLFYEALRIRLVEERIVQIYPSDKIQSPVHLSIGQEAVQYAEASPWPDDSQLYTDVL